MVNDVVIFATNLAANFDPAFERRIRTHVLFEMPGPVEREQIWRVQMHPSRTPLADDVDFRSLAEGYAVSGGDIRKRGAESSAGGRGGAGARLGEAHPPAAPGGRHRRCRRSGARDAAVGLCR